MDLAIAAGSGYSIGPVPAGLDNGTDVVHTTRPGFLRADQNLGLGRLVGDADGFVGVKDAIEAARSFSAGSNPAVVVREFSGRFYLNETGGLYQKYYNGVPWGAPYYEPDVLLPLRTGDTVERLHPSIAALVKGERVVSFADGFKVVLKD